MCDVFADKPNEAVLAAVDAELKEIAQGLVLFHMQDRRLDVQPLLRYSVAASRHHAPFTLYSQSYPPNLDVGQFGTPIQATVFALLGCCMAF